MRASNWQELSTYSCSLPTNCDVSPVPSLIACTAIDGEGPECEALGRLMPCCVSLKPVGLKAPSAKIGSKWWTVHSKSERRKPCSGGGIDGTPTILGRGVAKANIKRAAVGVSSASMAW